MDHTVKQGSRGVPSLSPELVSRFAASLAQPRFYVVSRDWGTISASVLVSDQPEHILGYPFDKYDQPQQVADAISIHANGR